VGASEAASGEGAGQVVCLVTSPPERARAIATAVVEGRLAACVNILGPVESIYRWQGKVEEDGDALLVIKTTRAAVEPLARALDVLHPYENFELVALEVAAGSPPYLRWITESVTAADAGARAAAALPTGREVPAATSPASTRRGSRIAPGKSRPGALVAEHDPDRREDEDQADGEGDQRDDVAVERKVERRGYY
jgi:periplasmic divalent cation tolerance protein